jgi:hypothetical protein
MSCWAVVAVFLFVLGALLLSLWMGLLIGWNVERSTVDGVREYGSFEPRRCQVAAIAALPDYYATNATMKPTATSRRKRQLDDYYWGSDDDDDDTGIIRAPVFCIVIGVQFENVTQVFAASPLMPKSERPSLNATLRANDTLAAFHWTIGSWFLCGLAPSSDIERLLLLEDVKLASATRMFDVVVDLEAAYRLLEPARSLFTAAWLCGAGGVLLLIVGAFAMCGCRFRQRSLRRRQKPVQRSPTPPSLPTPRETGTSSEPHDASNETAGFGSSSMDAAFDSCNSDSDLTVGTIPWIDFAADNAVY